MGTLYKATAPYPPLSYQANQPQESHKSGIRAFPYKYCQPSQWSCQEEDMAQSVLIDYSTSHLTKKETSTQDGDFSSASAISY
jgi:hypothetical protein